MFDAWVLFFSSRKYYIARYEVEKERRRKGKRKKTQKKRRIKMKRKNTKEKTQKKRRIVMNEVSMIRKVVGYSMMLLGAFGLGVSMHVNYQEIVGLKELNERLASNRNRVDGDMAFIAAMANIAKKADEGKEKEN